MSTTTAPYRLGLGLSGGGYRASAFHLGTLNKLEEMNILPEVNVLSTISGGSITGAAWCLVDEPYPSFHKKMIEKIRTKNVIRWIFDSPVFSRLAFFILFFLIIVISVLFTKWAPVALLVLILMFFLLFKYQFRIFPVSEEIERAYDSFFFQNKTLKDLKAKHILAIGSSNLETGRPFTFSGKKMSDSTYSQRKEYDPPIEFLHAEFPVSRAVMASSCVPFAFTPIPIHKKFYKNQEDHKRIHPQLVDGGVYDNQGIQKITQRKSSYECNNIIVSDAGGNFFSDKKYPNAIALLIRTVDLFMYRIKTTQMVQNIYRNVNSKPIAYFSLGWRLRECIPGFINNMIEGQVLPSVIAAHFFKPEWIENPASYRAEIMATLEKNTGYTKIMERDLTEEQWNIARSTGTNLKPLPETNIEYLVRHAENLTELQVKLYCPHLIN